MGMRVMRDRVRLWGCGDEGVLIAFGQGALKSAKASLDNSSIIQPGRTKEGWGLARHLLCKGGDRRVLGWIIWTVPL